MSDRGCTGDRGGPRCHAGSMTDTEGFTPASIDRFRLQVGDKLRGARFLEEAAQRFVWAVYDAFSPAVVLARLFVTQPYAKLPANVRRFVGSLASSKRIAVGGDLP